MSRFRNTREELTIEVAGRVHHVLLYGSGDG